ncbi:MAG: hypothetical protein KatS3mg010_1891 [Acidimicrobiia bacterium]|nr:MAG: hypothetical protein KatS3mg010_1891 [Acidimicrobiia bacterium]
MEAFVCFGSHPSSRRALETSNHSDSEYKSQWYGAKGAWPARDSTCIASRAGATGSERTREPVAAWSTSACNVSRMVPNSAAPTL